MEDKLKALDRAADQNRFDRTAEPTPPTYKETDGSNGSVYVEEPEQPDIFPSGFTMASAERSRSAESTRSLTKSDDLGTPQRTNVNASILSTPASQVAEALDDEDDDKEKIYDVTNKYSGFFGSIRRSLRKNI